MVRQVLYTPWRYSYITRETSVAPASGEGGCFFCAAAADSDDPERLVVYRSEHHLVLLNRHPYSSGHLMVAPLEHVASPPAASELSRAEFWPLVLLVQEVLEGTYSPDGMNLGMNLGRAAGAGVPGHFHFHLVPRWRGDSNFMGVVGKVRLVPEDPLAARERIRQRFAETSS